MAGKITDWVLELGFDGSKVEKGLSKVEKLMVKANKIEQKQLKFLKAKNVEIKKGNDLLKARNNLQNITPRLPPIARPVSPQPVTRPATPNRAPSIEQRERLSNRVRRSAVGVGDIIQVAPLSEAAIRLGQIQDRLRQIEKEVIGAKTPRELHKLNEEVKDLNTNTSRLRKTQNATAKQFKTTEFAANGLRDSLRNLSRSYISVFAVLATAGAALRTAKDFERIRAVMLLSSDGAEDAANNFKFVQDTAGRLGADISATADAFAGFNVSAMSAGVTAEESKVIFGQLATSIQATGLDAHRSGLAFLAFKQMLAGPVVQAQEMNQVVEQMPQFTGVARQALKELGHEGENFREIIATGTVDSEKFVRSVARRLNEQAIASGAAEKSQNNLIAAQNRMNNSLKNLA